MIDRVEIEVKAGDGGNGVVSFRHEKYVPLGGPDGGDGGRGGNVVMQADTGMTTLRRFHRGKKRFEAEKGANGGGKKMHGRNGQDLVLNVPLGTIISIKGDGQWVTVADIIGTGQEVIIARGGRGGHGNARFATSTNQAPHIAERGDPGEEASLLLELKLLADVGIIGHPSVGKSTLLAAASAARPKIADYPFTTTEPVLGVVDTGHRSFVLAEIPGLIEGAHRGKGLGLDFLRHAERTRVLIHLLDGGSEQPLADLEQVNREMSQFSRLLSQKPQIIAVNKIDLPDIRDRIPLLKRELKRDGESVYFISAATREGVEQLMYKVCEILESQPAPHLEEALAVFHPRPKREPVVVSREGKAFRVSSPQVERMVARMDLANAEARAYLRAKFDRGGVTSVLEKAGVKPGDIVWFGKIAMLWE